MLSRSGGCTCGRVRYTVIGVPTVVGLCHCTTCRKATGSGFLLYADWPLHAFQMTGGAESRLAAASAPPADRGSSTSMANGPR